ncbi:hypothetical protein [Nioella nitratireducens]|uniref:hypothetical protein n=1 Tax=Nioella nitratireducens TaxID=1287720 RepID=UPI0008FD1C43|nr:hypothetical protein [Nioella nitratireducens]
MMSRYHLSVGLIAAMTLLPCAALADGQPNEQLVRSVERELPNYVQGVDVDQLSAVQIAALHMAMGRSRGHSEIRGEVMSIIGGLDVLLFGRNLSFP